VTGYQCGSCSYESDDFDELRQHAQDNTGHQGVGDEGGIEATEVAAAAEGAEPTRGKSSKRTVAARLALGLLVATVGALLWEREESKSEIEGLKSENEYLKSASGTGERLRSFRRS